jgi:hypothetical protein
MPLLAAECQVRQCQLVETIYICGEFSKFIQPIQRLNHNWIVPYDGFFGFLNFNADLPDFQT